MEKIDPYKQKERYLKWKQTKEIDGVSKENEKIIVNLILDMEQGINIASGSRKGGRSYIRLNTIRNRLSFLAKAFEKRFKKNLTEVRYEDSNNFFTAMSNGEIKTNAGERYRSVGDYVNMFKTFWHWYMKVKRKEYKQLSEKEKKKVDVSKYIIEDITVDLDTSTEQPGFVYFTEDEFKKLVNRAKYEYKVLMWFLFDSGIRAPTELVNVRVSDLYENGSENYDLDIRDEISKTFGRKIKLLLCSKLLKEYIEEKRLKTEDILFPIVPRVANQYLKRLAKKVLGDKPTLGREKASNLSLYDFRHNSCCYWLPRYKSQNALMYRFGWVTPKYIIYYSQLLGMRDTIKEEDLLLEEGKAEIEKKLAKERQTKELSEERFKALEKRWGALEEKMEKQNEAEMQRRETLLKEVQELKELERELMKYKEFFEALKERLRTRSTR